MQRLGQSEVMRRTNYVQGEKFVFSMQRVEALLAVATSDAEWGAENKKSNKQTYVYFFSIEKKLFSAPGMSMEKKKFLQQ